MKRIISVVLMVTSLFCLIEKAEAFIAREQAKEIVVDQILGGDTTYVDVYASILPVSDTTQVESWRGVLSSPYSESWLFFIDDCPYANWEHPCRYAFVDCESGDYTVVEELSPLRNMSMVEQIVKCEIPQIQPQETRPDFVPSYAPPDPTKYAVLINGGADPFNNWDKFWNDLSAIYTTLVQHYGYLDDHIYVLCSDGTDPGLDQHIWYTDVYINSDSDLDKDGDPDIGYAATHQNVVDVFQVLQGILTPSDQLFVFITDHGGSENIWTYDSYFYLWDWEMMRDDELAALVEPIDCSDIIFVFEPCYSGGFVDDLSAENHRVIHTSTNEWELGRAEFYRSGGHYDEFVYYWTAAVRGYFPGWDSTDVLTPWRPWEESGSTGWIKARLDTYYVDLAGADRNQDGLVSMEEAFAFVDSVDTWSPNGIWDPWNPNYEEYPQEAYTPVHNGDILHLSGRSGKLSADQSWLGYYPIVGDVTVPEDITLTLQESTTVEFETTDAESSGIDPDRCELEVQGTLIAEGTSSEPIVFTSIGADPQPGDWYGIRFLGSSVDSACVVKNCQISYAYEGIYCYDASPEISSNEIAHCTYGVYCIEGASPEISDNKLQDISACGIYCYSDCAPDVISDTLGGKGYADSRGINCWNSSPQIQGGVVENFECGINCCGGDSIIITGVRVSNNPLYGIACNVLGVPPEEGDCDPSSPTITENIIHGSEYGLFIGALSEAFIAGNTIYKNELGIRAVNSASVVSGNKIVQNNSVGVYCSGVILPNLGDLSNADTTDDGYNEICGNRSYEVFNEASDTVQAENNWWGQYPPESSQFSGLVDYDPAREQSSDTTAPAAITDLSVTLIKVPSHSGVFLRWSEISTDVEGKLEFISHYLIYRDTTHDYEPTSAQSLAVVPDTTFEYFDSGVVDQTGVNYYYVVKAVDYGANKSATSNMVGEFDKSLSDKGGEPPWPPPK